MAKLCRVDVHVVVGPPCMVDLDLFRLLSAVFLAARRFGAMLPATVRLPVDRMETQSHLLYLSLPLSVFYPRGRDNNGGKIMEWRIQTEPNDIDIVRWPWSPQAH